MDRFSTCRIATRTRVLLLFAVLLNATVTSAQDTGPSITDRLKELSSVIDVKSILTGADDIHVDNDPDNMRRMQSEGFIKQSAAFGRWGHIKDRYSTWTNHSNRLIPLYSFGFSLDALRREGSAYANSDRLKRIYGHVPSGTLNPDADYFDQTDIYRLQKGAIAAGFKNIIVMVFDGMDWQTTRAASLYKTGKVAYTKGRGTGLSFQDFDSATTDFALVCSSPYSETMKQDVNSQLVLDQPKRSTGGYDIRYGGKVPWLEKPESDYLIGLLRERPHAVTDSAAAATSLFSGLKTYNASINVAANGKQLTPIAVQLQKRGFKVGMVTSVPISHATPACAYANNVYRKDYQDIARDLIGFTSASHRTDALPGVDVLIGAGWGETKEEDTYQGRNFLVGNIYLHSEDLKKADVANGGRYVVSQRTKGTDGGKGLMAAAKRAAKQGDRLLGFYGVKLGHLPYQTADGEFNPTVDVTGIEKYTKEDLDENPTLAEMTEAALTYMQTAEQGFWLLVEAGDVDWANHANNVDSSIGAVFSGEAAFNSIIRWVEKNDGWSETALIVTADHGHYMVIQDPELIAKAGREQRGE